MKYLGLMEGNTLAVGSMGNSMVVDSTFCPMVQGEKENGKKENALTGLTKVPKRISRRTFEITFP